MWIFESTTPKCTQHYKLGVVVEQGLELCFNPPICVLVQDTHKPHKSMRLELCAWCTSELVDRVISNTRPLSRRNPSLHTCVHVLASKKYDRRLMQVFCVYRLVAENVEIFLDYKHMYQLKNNIARLMVEASMFRFSGLACLRRMLPIFWPDARMLHLVYVRC